MGLQLLLLWLVRGLRDRAPLTAARQLVDAQQSPALHDMPAGGRSGAVLLLHHLSRGQARTVLTLNLLEVVEHLGFGLEGAPSLFDQTLMVKLI